jgi:UDP-glucose 4-epimerase
MTTASTPDLAALRDKRILITGGAGLIGSHLTDLLVRVPAREIVILDNLSRGRLDNLSCAMGTGLVTFIEGDIRDRALLSRALRHRRAFHPGRHPPHPLRGEPELASSDGGWQLQRARGGGRTAVGRISVASSASIYGMAGVPTNRRASSLGQPDPVRRGQDVSRRSAGIVSGHAWARLRRARPFNVYGPRMDREGAYTEVLIRWMERIDGDCPRWCLASGGQNGLRLCH